jgi:hypothetical protein
VDEAIVEQAEQHHGSTDLNYLSAPPSRRKQLHTLHTAKMSDAHHAEMDRRLQTVEAQKGRLTCTLMWHNENDLDLTCFTPAGEKIWYMKKQDDARTGHLDVDMNRHEDDVNHEPIENIYFEHPPPGKYRFVYVASAPHCRAAGAKRRSHSAWRCAVAWRRWTWSGHRERRRPTTTCAWSTTATCRIKASRTSQRMTVSLTHATLATHATQILAVPLMQPLSVQKCWLLSLTCQRGNNRGQTSACAISCAV